MATAPLAASAGFVAALAGFCATWLAAWIAYNVISPDGVAILHTLLGWRYLYRDQAERHRYYRRKGGR